MSEQRPEDARVSSYRTLLRVLGAITATLLFLSVALVYPLAARGARWLDAKWNQPWMLFLLIVVPPIWVWSIFAKDKFRPRLRIGTVAPLLRGPRGWRTWLRDLPGAMRSVAFVMLIIAMARPILVLTEQSAEERGIDIAIVMDLSGSMKGVIDASPKDLPHKIDLKPGYRPTRLDTAKAVVRDFISRRNTDRIGVVVFGKDAYILSPPTLDYPLLSRMVKEMELGVIDQGGTAIGDALSVGVAQLHKSDALSKVVILITDGDNNSGKYSPEYATKLAKHADCKVYTIQIGVGDEVEVQSGVDLRGNPTYMPQRYAVNPELLQSIATETGGEAFIATDARGLSRSMHSILDSLEKTGFAAPIADHEELFSLLLIPGVFLIGLEALLRAWLLRRFP